MAIEKLTKTGTMNITSSTSITIDVDKQKKGNLFALTDAVNPGLLDPCDTIYGVTLQTDITGAKVKGNATLKVEDLVAKMPKMKQRLEVTDHKGEKLVLEYCTQTGFYDIIENDFAVNELASLQLKVLRFNANRLPVGEAVPA